MVLLLLSKHCRRLWTLPSNPIFHHSQQSLTIAIFPHTHTNTPLYLNSLQPGLPMFHVGFFFSIISSPFSLIFPGPSIHISHFLICVTVIFFLDLRPIRNPKHPSSCEFSCIVFSASFCFMGLGCQFKAQPQTWRTRVSLFVWNLTLHLSCLGAPSSSYITTGISLEKLGWHHQGGFELVKYCYLLFLHHWHKISHHPAI